MGLDSFVKNIRVPDPLGEQKCDPHKRTRKRDDELIYVTFSIYLT